MSHVTYQSSMKQALAWAQLLNMIAHFICMNMHYTLGAYSRGTKLYVKHFTLLFTKRVAISLYDCQLYLSGNPSLQVKYKLLFCASIFMINRHDFYFWSQLTSSTKTSMRWVICEASTIAVFSILTVALCHHWVTWTRVLTTSTHDHSSVYLCSTNKNCLPWEKVNSP